MGFLEPAGMVLDASGAGQRRSSAPSSGRAAGAQSSNAMMMSAPIWFWTRMLDSGPRCTLEPSMKLRNVTPSSPSTAVSLML